jgi:hypothetical protein
MHTKFVIFVVIVFLTISLIYSSFSRPILALKIIKYGEIQCENFGDRTVKCCQNQTDEKGETHRYCTTCDKTDPPSNCSPRWEESSGPSKPQSLKSVLPYSPAQSSSIAPPSTSEQSNNTNVLDGKVLKHGGILKGDDTTQDTQGTRQGNNSTGTLQ